MASNQDFILGITFNGALMNTQNTSPMVLDDRKVHVKLKLAALWAGFMFFYLYVDYFHLFMPGALQNLSAGKAYVFEITQVFLLVVLVAVTIPAVMIFLAVALPAKINRCTNLIMATLYIPFSLFNLAGEAWMHMVFAAVVEVLLLCSIIFYAWKWPRS